MSRSQLIALPMLMLAFSIVGQSRAELRTPTEDIVAPRTARALAEAFAAKSYEEALQRYSERGAEYVGERLSIIHSNALHVFDATQLAPSGGSLVIVPAP